MTQLSKERAVQSAWLTLVVSSSNRARP